MINAKTLDRLQNFLLNHGKGIVDESWVDNFLLSTVIHSDGLGKLTEQKVCNLRWEIVQVLPRNAAKSFFENDFVKRARVDNTSVHYTETFLFFGHGSFASGSVINDVYSIESQYDLSKNCIVATHHVLTYLGYPDAGYDVFNLYLYKATSARRLKS
jgi:hypothetical protein